MPSRSRSAKYLSSRRADCNVKLERQVERNRKRQPRQDRKRQAFCSPNSGDEDSDYPDENQWHHGDESSSDEDHAPGYVLDYAPSPFDSDDFSQEEWDRFYG